MIIINVHIPTYYKLDIANLSDAKTSRESSVCIHYYFLSSKTKLTLSQSLTSEGRVSHVVTDGRLFINTLCSTTCRIKMLRAV